jgi:short-subunit dehydrogenase
MGNIVITGASRGIGYAIANIFAQPGNTLYLTSRHEKNLQTAIEHLQHEHPYAEIRGIPFDLAKKENAIEFSNWCLEQAVPDIVINNAGFFKPGTLSDGEDGLLESLLSINLFSAYYLIRGFLPAMKKNEHGHIFNLCSIASLKAFPNGAAYSVSKFALYGFSQNLREELKPYRIKVTAVMPGAVITDSWGDYDNSQQRLMETSDIAKMIYAASELSPAACVEDIILRPELGDL